MLANCFRFAPRDSVPGLIAKICKYLKDHPGWSEAELEEQIKQLVGQTGVESFNGRTGAVVLNESDVNNLKIASAYFAEGDETIDKLDLVTLYNQGVRFVFTNWNSVTSGYDMSFVLDYFSGSGNVVYYPIASASVGSSESPVVSVNSMTGAVTIPVVDVSESDSKNQFAKIFINEGEDYPIAPSYDSDRLGGKPPSYYAYAEDVDYKLSKLNEANATQNTEIAKKANDADLAAVAKSGSYDDLTNKPTIPTVPTTLPNPNKLTFTGAVTAEYDGSAPVSVEIPAGGSGSYTLPIASSTTLGGVKPEAKTDAMNQPVGVDANGRLYAPAAALPTDEQVGTAVDAYLTANGVKCNDVWVDLGTVTVAEGEEPKILGWNLAGTIKKFCIGGSTPAHGGSGNKQILPRGGMSKGTSSPFFTAVGNWGDDTSLTYYYSVYAEKIKNGIKNNLAWWGVGGCSQFRNIGSTYLSPCDIASADNPSSGLYIATHWIDTVFPVGATFRAWVVYE